MAALASYVDLRDLRNTMVPQKSGGSNSLTLNTISNQSWSSNHSSGTITDSTDENKWEAVGIRVPEYTLSVTEPERHDNEIGPYITYYIRLQSHSTVFRLERTKVRRRYSEFVWLRKELDKLDNWTSPPALPPKKLFRQLDVKHLEERRHGLEKWLHDILSAAHYLSYTGLHLFLQTELPVKDIQDYLAGEKEEEELEAIWKNNGKLYDCQAYTLMDISYKQDPIEIVYTPEDHRPPLTRSLYKDVPTQQRRRSSVNKDHTKVITEETRGERGENGHSLRRDKILESDQFLVSKVVSLDDKLEGGEGERRGGEGDGGVEVEVHCSGSATATAAAAAVTSDASDDDGDNASAEDREVATIDVNSDGTNNKVEADDNTTTTNNNNTTTTNNNDDSDDSGITPTTTTNNITNTTTTTTDDNSVSTNNPTPKTTTPTPTKILDIPVRPSRELAATPDSGCPDDEAPLSLPSSPSSSRPSSAATKPSMTTTMRKQMMKKQAETKARKSEEADYSINGDGD